MLHLLTNHLPAVELDHPIVTRDFTPPKPSPEPLQHIAQNWEADPSLLIMVGDSADDMLSGHSAGFTTVLITSEANQHLKTLPLVDFVVDSYVYSHKVDFYSNNTEPAKRIVANTLQTRRSRSAFGSWIRAQVIMFNTTNTQISVTVL